MTERSNAAAPEPRVEDAAYETRMHIQKLRWMGLDDEADEIASRCGAPAAPDFAHRLPVPPAAGSAD
jgi:hypothetical protein